MFGPWLPHAAGTERKQRHAAVVREFVLGPKRKRGCQIPWRQFVDVVCPDICLHQIRSRVACHPPALERGNASGKKINPESLLNFREEEVAKKNHKKWDIRLTTSCV